MSAGQEAHGTDDRPVRPVLVFTTVALALFMMSVDTTIVATALHPLQHGLHTSINWAGWTITAYSFGFVLMLPISGRLSERYGRRRVFLGSVVVFATASLLCGMAENIYVLIALRAAQAAGGAGFTPSATGIIVDYFGKSRDRAISLFGSIFQIGTITGPIFGGLFVSYWTWRGVFFVNVPISVAIIGLALRYIPPDRPKGEQVDHGGMDAVGMGLLGGGLLAGMLATTYLGGKDAQVWSPSFIAPLVIAVAALFLFFRHIRNAAHPFIAPRLIHGPGFGAVNLFNVSFSGLTGGMMALTPLYASSRFGIGALESGTLLTAQGAAAIILSILSALALRRTGHRLPMRVGSAIIITGMLLLSLSPIAGVSPYMWLTGSTFLIGIGAGMVNPATRNAGMQLAPGQASSIAALRTMCMSLGSMTTISMATAILASSNDPGHTQAWIFVMAAVLLTAAATLLISRVPEHRGSW